MKVVTLVVGRVRGDVAIAIDDRPVRVRRGRRRQTRAAVRRVGQVGRDERQVEMGIPGIFPEIVLVQIVKNAVLAAPDEVAPRRDQHDAGSAEVLILVRARKIAERAPEVDDRELRLAIVDVGDSGRVAKLDEALGEIARFGPGSIPLPVVR